MNRGEIQPVILAAGKGTRMHIVLPKALFSMNGKPMVSYVIEALAGDPGYGSPIIVVGYHSEHVKHALGEIYRYAEQKEINGTATAVEAAVPFMGDEPVLVLYADNPFISTESLTRMRQMFLDAKPTVALFSVRLPNFKGKYAAFKDFGRVKRDERGKVIGIVESKNATPEEREILEVTPGGTCFDPAWLLGALARVKVALGSGERTLTQVIEIAVNEGCSVITVPIPPEESFGINSHRDARLVKII